MPVLDLGKVIGPQGPQGATGPQGPQGPQGEPGADATINGHNAVTITTTANSPLKIINVGDVIGLSLSTDAVPTPKSSNPVTSDGLYNALNGKLDASAGWEVLWTNTRLDSDFIAQDIGIDGLNNYNMFMVTLVYNHTYSADFSGSAIYAPGNGYKLHAPFVWYTGSGDLDLSYRIFTFSKTTNKVSVTAAHRFVGTTPRAESASYAIPYQILGCNV